MSKEEFAMVLDFLPEGKYTDFKRKPVVQSLGTQFFTLLELIPKEEVKFESFEKVFVGKGDRDKIQLVKRTLPFKELTHNASSNLDEAVEKIIDENSERFLDFYNKSGPVSLRMHRLELLPGIGKKHVQTLLREREKKPFESFDEISERVPLIPSPKKVLVNRVLSEIRGEEKYYFFAKRPSTGEERDFRRPGGGGGFRHDGGSRPPRRF
ncbi:MAG: DUF655 domain-containing protein [Candidatus Diapherotrites archaeon]|nr:DUF655 domain-containing protein [Candidatus Diapherotrites archaeon]